MCWCGPARAISAIPSRNTTSYAATWGCAVNSVPTPWWWAFSPPTAASMRNAPATLCNSPHPCRSPSTALSTRYTRTPSKPLRPSYAAAATASSPPAAVPTLRALHAAANGRITILAGAGVTPANAARIVQETGVTEIHGSCKHTLPDGTVETDPQIVEQLIKSISQ